MFEGSHRNCVGTVNLGGRSPGKQHRRLRMKALMQGKLGTGLSCQLRILVGPERTSLKLTFREKPITEPSIPPTFRSIFHNFPLA